MPRKPRNEERRNRVVKLISQWPLEHDGSQPTIRELAAVEGCAVATMHHHVKSLTREGLVWQTPGKVRTLRAVG